jgi:amino acid transporter
MINPEDDSQTSIIERSTEYKPPHTWRSWLIGRPLSTADAPHQTIGKVVGLAVFSSDALSSVAYGPQEIFGVLAAAGTIAMGYAFPLALAIVGLLVMLTLSYEQTIHAYPDGGGAYIVARDNLGELPALVAAASLLTDYILTVSVSVASGVAQITSAFPILFEYRVQIAVALVLFVMLINLRGVKESGIAFAIPTYFFLVTIFITVGVGFFRYWITRDLGMVVNPPELDLVHGTQPLTLFLILRAFASGTTSLTGVEAISNGITAFKEPRSKNAGITLIWMSVILGFMLTGITFLARKVETVFSETETVISQLGRTVFLSETTGELLLGGIPYLMLIAGTAVILIMAANTAFADFPRLSALAAKDGFLPRQLAYRGSRLVYSRGIVTLALIASFLIAIFQASVTRLIPLYAIGVFLSFTLSQGGMSHRWWKIGKLKPSEEVVEAGSTLHHDPRWVPKMIINGFGAILTAVVMMVFAVTKFRDGAYLVLFLIPILVAIFWSIHRHYKNLARKLSLENIGAIPPQRIRHRVIMPVSGVHQGSLTALRYARMLSDDVTAVHVSIEPTEAEKVRKKWEKWGEGVRLVMVDSPYRLFLEPLLEYIADIAEQRQPGETITIVVPEFVSDNRLSSPLHMNTANILRQQLKNQHGIVITNVPYHVHEYDHNHEHGAV